MFHLTPETIKNVFEGIFIWSPCRTSRRLWSEPLLLPPLLWTCQIYLFNKMNEAFKMRRIHEYKKERTQIEWKCVYCLFLDLKLEIFAEKTYSKVRLVFKNEQKTKSDGMFKVLTNFLTTYLGLNFRKSTSGLKHSLGENFVHISVPLKSHCQLVCLQPWHCTYLCMCTYLLLKNI